MPSLGWQELMILIFIFVLAILPIVVVWRGSKRRTGEVSAGWVIGAVFFGWLGALAWALLGRRSPRPMQMPQGWGGEPPSWS